jgi:hypothetical protein
MICPTAPLDERLGIDGRHHARCHLTGERELGGLCQPDAVCTAAFGLRDAELDVGGIECAGVQNFDRSRLTRTLVQVGDRREAKIGSGDLDSLLHGGNVADDDRPADFVGLVRREGLGHDLGPDPAGISGRNGNPRLGIHARRSGGHRARLRHAPVSSSPSHSFGSESMLSYRPSPDPSGTPRTCVESQEDP